MIAFLPLTVAVACVLGGVFGQYRESKEREFYESKFFEFIKTYNIEIRDDNEYDYRFTIFSKRYDEIEEFNAKHDHVKWGINKFSHLTSEEFAAYVNNGGTIIKFPYRDDDFKASKPDHHWNNDHDGDEGTLEASTTTNVPAASLPTSIDWVAAGAVTPVKDQGNCGSCWSFSVC